MTCRLLAPFPVVVIAAAQRRGSGDKTRDPVQPSAGHGHARPPTSAAEPERATYYLVGDHAGVGEVAFTFGGQPEGNLAARYLVEVDRAVAVAQEFLATGTVEESTGAWDRD